jgi:solute carrier family 35, member F5
LLALASAVFYALYVILLKVQIKEESRIDMQLFFGFVGLFNAIGGLPIAALLHVIGAEKFELPTTKKAVGALLINVCLIHF